MSPQLSVSYQWMSNFQFVQMGGLEDYFPYWHVISVISLLTGFLFMHFQNILFPFKMGIVLMSLKISETDRLIMWSSLICTSCGDSNESSGEKPVWQLWVTLRRLDRHMPFLCSMYSICRENEHRANNTCDQKQDKHYLSIDKSEWLCLCSC